MIQARAFTFVCTKDAPRSWKYEPAEGVECPIKGSIYISKSEPGFAADPPRYLKVTLHVPETVGLPGDEQPNPVGIHPNYAATGKAW